MLTTATILRSADAEHQLTTTAILRQFLSKDHIIGIFEYLFYIKPTISKF